MLLPHPPLLALLAISTDPLFILLLSPARGKLMEAEMILLSRGVGEGGGGLLRLRCSRVSKERTVFFFVPTFDYSG